MAAKKPQLFDGGDVVIRKCGNYINTIHNSEESIRKWIISNVTPPWDIEDGRTGLSCMMTTRELMNIASEKELTFTPQPFK